MDDPQAALDAFQAAQRASWLAFRKANPGLVEDMKQAEKYDAALRRQAFFQGLQVPKHRRE